LNRRNCREIAVIDDPHLVERHRGRFYPVEILVAAVIVVVLGLIAANVFVFGPVAPAGAPPCWVLPFAPHNFLFFGSPAR
jgi:hypothetical protein